MKFQFLWVLILTGFLTSCKEPLPEISDQEAVDMVGKELLRHIKLIYTDTGRLVLRVEAPLMVRQFVKGQNKDEFPNGMKAVFYSNGLVSNILTSRYAVRVPDEGKTYLSQDVVLDNPRGEKLETSELIWDERARRVHTDKFVRLSRKDEVIHAYGFESDQNFTEGVLLSTEARFPSSKLLGEIDEQKEE
jgi:LPS export ABC transporter protein LptC